MKKLLVLAVATLLCSITGYAQIERKTDSSQKVQRKHNQEQMYRALQLNAAQKDSIASMQKEMKRRITSMRENPERTPAARREKYREIRHYRKTQLNKILSPEQQSKMKEWQQQRKNTRQKEGRHHKGRHQKHKNVPEAKS